MSKSKLSSTKEVNCIIRACEKAGWRVLRNGGGHIKVYPPTGDIIIISSTPRNIGNIHLVKRKLQKMGLTIK